MMYKESFSKVVSGFESQVIDSFSKIESELNKYNYNTTFHTLSYDIQQECYDIILFFYIIDHNFSHFECNLIYSLDLDHLQEREHLSNIKHETYFSLGTKDSYTLIFEKRYNSYMHIKTVIDKILYYVNFEIKS
ncbi:hypothetical protein [Mycoplasma sp. P36-A1]|uniref:hypothetical protein n=1 Tax=Mycoplasma sp. P36-A1 TaxID=3252900 RepID=UPI003C2F7483